MKKQKVLGIIGGMGPLATMHFFGRIVSLTVAEKDQDHPRILIDNNPKIPDRTEAILYGGPSPAPAVIRSGKTLIRAGADFLAIPCVTVHHYYDEIRDALSVP